MQAEIKQDEEILDRLVAEILGELAKGMRNTLDDYFVNDPVGSAIFSEMRGYDSDLTSDELLEELNHETR